MKWTSHKIISLASGIVLELPLCAMAGLFLGSIIPDVLDMTYARLSKNPQKTFKRIHRGISHWYGTYLFFALTCFYFMPSLNTQLKQLNIEQILLQIGFGFNLGALMHIFLDMCTYSGVPIRPFTKKKRISLRLFSTGSIKEYLLLSFVVIGFIFYLWETDEGIKLLNLKETLIKS